MLSKGEWAVGRRGQEIFSPKIFSLKIFSLSPKIFSSNTIKETKRGCVRSVSSFGNSLIHGLWSA